MLGLGLQEGGGGRGWWVKVGRGMAGTVKADLHGTILSHTTSLRHILDHDCHKVLKHVFKSYNFFCVVSMS